MNENKLLSARLRELEKELGKEYDEKAKQFLQDHLCFVCGKPVSPNSSYNQWCHRYDCRLQEEDCCECALEVHPDCCSEACFNFYTCKRD
jgi:hypothetical protein